MEAVIFIGMQAAGKSTFYAQRFFHSHLRINLDMLKTRHREKTLLAACLAIGQPLVVDNTNLTVAARQPYVAAARSAGFRVVGYYFQSQVAACLARNAERPESRRVPDKAIYGASARLELPSPAEGFAELWYVRVDG
ncbi:MAG TPA: ATP-binding protein, partial [Herpetosiphonaceae bacterium]|nr:ATP-binding protein [Herpetosiphonaceae bacterium]